jgi:hydrogenase-4 component A
MNRFILADPSRCIGCNTCMAACTQVHKAQGLKSLPRLTVMRTQAATAPVACRHCEAAPCAHICPVNAITFGPDSIMLNEQTCIGCKMCVLACPFGAITLHGAITQHGAGIAGVAGIRLPTPASSAAPDPLLAWDNGVRSVALKCDMCNFNANGPECVRVCPTNALFVVDDEGLARTRLARRDATVPMQALRGQFPPDDNPPR